MHRAARLYVDEEALHRPEWVVYGEVVVEVLHQQQFVGQNDVHRLVPVPFDVVHELADGHVKLLHLARQVHAGGQDLLRVEVHRGVVEVEALEVVERSPGHALGHRRLEALAKVLQVELVGTEQGALLFRSQEEVIVRLVLEGEGSDL